MPDTPTIENGYVIRVGADSHGHYLYVTDPDKKAAAHMNPALRDKVLVFEDRDEAQSLLEEIAEWDHIAANLAAVVQGVAAIERYENIAGGDS